MKYTRDFFSIHFNIAFEWSKTRAHFRCDGILYCCAAVKSNGKLQKFIFNVFKKLAHIDSNELNRRDEYFVSIWKSAHHSLARHLLPIYCCYAQNILHFSNSFWQATSCHLCSWFGRERTNRRNLTQDSM